MSPIRLYRIACSAEVLASVRSVLSLSEKDLILLLIFSHPVG
jgi:hypothetical protein